MAVEGGSPSVFEHRVVDFPRPRCRLVVPLGVDLGAWAEHLPQVVDVLFVGEHATVVGREDPAAAQVEVRPLVEDESPAAEDGTGQVHHALGFRHPHDLVDEHKPVVVGERLRCAQPHPKLQVGNPGEGGELEKLILPVKQDLHRIVLADGDHAVRDPEHPEVSVLLYRLRYVGALAGLVEDRVEGFLGLLLRQVFNADIPDPLQPSRELVVALQDRIRNVEATLALREHRFHGAVVVLPQVVPQGAELLDPHGVGVGDQQHLAAVERGEVHVLEGFLVSTPYACHGRQEAVPRESPFAFQDHIDLLLALHKPDLRLMGGALQAFEELRQPVERQLAVVAVLLGQRL